MKTRSRIQRHFAALILALVPSAALGQTAPPDSPQSRKIVDLVEKAATQVNAHGKVAFDEFRKKGSEWFDGETYLFSYDAKANVLLNPAFPKREGTNVSGQTDATGKKFHDLMLETARTKGSGWVDYMFPKPGQTTPSHKWTYVKRVTIDGAPALLGAGFYAD
ncbi:MAG TPA: cache domain-containing protein [Myxococcaceae bacterium]|nr:cache domain-containing protein [Myxococcaceae bacterium]